MNYFVRRADASHWPNRISAAFFLAATVFFTNASADDGTPSDMVERGERTYLINCSRCHGVRLINPVGYTFDLRRFPPNQRERFFNSVSNGKGNMPAWGDLLMPDQIEALWSYVRTEGQNHRP